MFVLYNVMAFLTQPLTGMLADRVRQRHLLLLSAVALLAIGGLIVSSWALAGHGDRNFDPSLGQVPVPVTRAVPFALALVLGAGNSLFHVWGGKQTVDTLGNNPKALGTFVSTGALGLAVGVVFFSWMLLATMITLTALLSAMYVFMDTKTSRYQDSKASRLQGIGNTRLVTIVTVSVVVLLVMFRSFVSRGFSMPVGELTGTLAGNAGVLLVGLVSMLGKMFGGWLAWWMGMARSMLLVLFVVFFCYLSAAAGSVIPLLPGLFAVNCTMPVTLCVANSAMHGREGLAFGLLAAALVPGYLLAIS